MNYIGEHLLSGRLGHLAIIVSFISSLGASVCYFLSVQAGRQVVAGSASLALATSPQAQWKHLARLFFYAEAVSVLLIFSILFYIISHHFFEYKYAWQHSSLSLEPKYLLSCFWEGQEGSFLLWSFWHCVLGAIVIRKQTDWEGPVMAVVCFAQMMLATMLLGLQFGSMHLGSNPFILLRNSGVLDKAPAFYTSLGTLRPDYLSLIADGNDLNPLLQNYWMVIHPPVLFLGFASTIIPFAFVVGGLWTNKLTQWTKPALPWTLFSAGVLGTGIMMGAAWAYESLNFGGYWAWDPVENASLVPWLILVAGLHTLVIYRHTGNALRTTCLFLILSFLFVLYSTYLTRSGDLQETSVHAFTGEGITKWHLRFLLLALALPSLALLVRRYKSIPFIVKEEESSSREFWMFIGSLVLFLSSLVIIAMTSIPVFNKLASLFTTGKIFTPIAVGEDAAYQYNQIQIFVAIILAILTAVGMYFKYKISTTAFLKKLSLPLVLGVALGCAVVYFGHVDYRDKSGGFMIAIWVAVVAAVFSVVANTMHLFAGAKANLRKAGGVISHIGFATLLVGILISSSKKEVLSMNTTGIPVNFGEGSKEKPGENLTLVKGLRTDMGKYWVTYSSDSAHPKKPLWFYALNFQSKDSTDSFTLAPNAFVNYKNQSGLMANPDSKHYWNYDIFTYITSLMDASKKEDTAHFKSVDTRVGDTVFYSSGFVVVQDVGNYKNIPGAQLGVGDSASIATLKVFAKTGTSYTRKPFLVTKGGQNFLKPDTLTAESLVLQVQKVEGNKLQLGIKESEALLQYVTLKAYKFPFINLVWLGSIITVSGFFISLFYRRKQNRLKVSKMPPRRHPEASAQA